MGESFGAVCAICCCLFPPLILHSVGFFTPKWVSNGTCDSVGLIYSCCSGSDNMTCANTNGSDELDVRALGLHATAFTVMFLAVVGSCFESCCNKDDEDTGWCGIIGGCCIILYPVAGLFSFIGCMLLVPNYSASQLGYSFILCLTSGIMVIVITIILCAIVCRIVAKDMSDDVENKNTSQTNEGVNVPQSNEELGYGTVQPYHSYEGAAAPYGGTRMISAQQATIEQTAVVQDPESGGFMMLIRKYNITRIVSTIAHHDD